MNIHSIIQKIKDAPRNIKYGIENLIQWFPVIWKDRDWDHCFLYMILKYKLERMEKAFHSNKAMGLCSNKEAKKMRLCINLLKRLIEDEYNENASIEYHKKWGRPKFNWIPVDDECSSLEITHEKVKTEEDKIQEKKEFHRICDHEKNMRKQDIEYLFKYMSKHIEGWWD